MTMNLKTLQLKLILLDPYSIVKAGIDNFDAYSYIELPADLAAEVQSLSESDQNKWDEFEQWYLDTLCDTGELGAFIEALREIQLPKDEHLEQLRTRLASTPAEWTAAASTLATEIRNLLEAQRG